MKTFCRKVFPGVLALLLTFTLIVPASAAEYGFSDVPADSPWYESVAYIAERGITIGTGEGRYSPDAPITTRQWAVMLCRAYGKTDVLAGDGGNFVRPGGDRQTAAGRGGAVRLFQAGVPAAPADGK